MGAFKVILLSGEVCTGKSNIANWLSSIFGFKHIKTSEFLKAANPGVKTRKELQNAGNGLGKTKPEWLLEGVSSIIAADSSTNAVRFVGGLDVDKIKKLQTAYNIECDPEKLMLLIQYIGAIKTNSEVSRTIRALENSQVGEE